MEILEYLTESSDLKAYSKESEEDQSLPQTPTDTDEENVPFSDPLCMLIEL